MSWTASLRSLWDPLTPLAAAAQASLADTETSVLIQRARLWERLSIEGIGARRSHFMGTGLDFKQLRAYQPGDDIRQMDWNVLARTGVPHVKEYDADQHATVWFFVDATATMAFGQRQTKFHYAQQLVSLFGILALQDGHRLGLIVWNGTSTPLMIAPESNEAHLERLLKTLQQTQIIPSAVQITFPDLPRLIRQRGMVIFLSDFAFVDAAPSVFGLLSRLHMRHQCLYFALTDPVEQSLLSQGDWMTVTGYGMNNQTQWIDLSNAADTSAYQAQFKAAQAQRLQQLGNVGRATVVAMNQTPLEFTLHWIHAA